jgi:hypothetical protein
MLSHNTLPLKLRRVMWGLLLMLSVACAPSTPLTSPPTVTPSLMPSPTLTPSPTFTPTPTPTPTPIPPARLDIHRPDKIWALEPTFIEAVLLPPPGVPMTATLSASVRDPEGFSYWSSAMMPQSPDHYISETSFRLPLEPMPGDWRLVVEVQSDLAVEGPRELIFRPDPIPLRDLNETFDMQVPQAFAEVTNRGNQTAGVREWRHGDGMVELWWAPGPTEPLLLNNAIVMLETTYGLNNSPRVLDVQDVVLQGRSAFLFREDWPGARGGPAKALVAQGPDYELYVVRVQALGHEEIPSLPHQVWSTFTFVE